MMSSHSNYKVTKTHTLIQYLEGAEDLYKEIMTENLNLDRDA